MKTLSFSQDIALRDDYDVIVVGGGPSGCTAAAAAAREGAKTLLVEQTSSLGGMGTSGLVPAWCPFSDKEKIIYRGLADKVFSNSKAGMRHINPEAMDWVAIDPEHLKRVYDALVVESGAQILFNTFLSSVQCSNGRVTSIVLANKAGLTAFTAKTYIDTTGDADLAAWAGADFEKGDGTGDLQPATHCFTLSNVDEYGYRHSPNLHPSNPNSAMYKILADGKYPEIPDVHACNNLIGPGAVGFNAGHLWKVDNTQPETVSLALVQGRKIAKAFLDALTEYCPQTYGNAFLAQTGSLLGIRETRRIVGDYTLVLDDYLQLRSFDDEICRNSYFIDVHSSISQTSKTKEGTAKLEHKSFRLKPGESHGIPYRCLIPKGIKNVLVAGRSISCDRNVQGSVRVMPVCLAMGEAAGIAAALSMQTPDCDVHAVDPQLLRKRLREEGAYLP